MGLESGANNRPLREELEEITDRYTGDRIGEQIGRIAALALKYKHSISLVQEAIPDKPKTFRFNCHQHSFGLINVKSVNHIMRSYASVFPGREFVQFLIDKRLHDVSLEQAQDGDHVVYAAGSRIEHAGRVNKKAIESKWGLGHTWRHGLYEVPWRYGNVVRFFSHLSQEESVRAFLHYAARRGVVNS